MAVSENVRAALRRGLVIPAHPLALTAERRLDERRQTALTRYYCDAGSGGVTVAGVCGTTPQAVAEAELARSLGYDLGLLSLGALAKATNQELLAHCRTVADIIPICGFYLQPAVGGRVLDYGFWRGLLEVEGVVAIKVAPFNRYQTLDVARAVADSGRGGEVALYTGNDDNIVGDLLTAFPGPAPVRFTGGLLGQWAVWTSRAVDLLRRAQEARRSGTGVPDLLAEGAQLTDANGAIFDVRNAFAGCIAGIHEVLRAQGLLAGRWCLDPNEDLSPGQLEEIERVRAAYPGLADDAFVAQNRDRWLA